MASNVLCTHHNKPLMTGLQFTLNRTPDTCLELTDHMCIEGLSTLFNCEKCHILTPGYEDRLKGTIRALAWTVFYCVMRPFAWVVSICISSNTDPKINSSKFKIGKLMTVPYYYSKFEFQKLVGYICGGSKGKARVIVAQTQQQRLREIIFASHFTEVKQYFNRVFSETGYFTDDQMNQDLLTRLRRNDLPLKEIIYSTLLKKQDLILSTQR